METHYPAGSPESEFRIGELYTIHRRLHRLLAIIVNGLLLIDVASHHLHLVQHPGGGIGLPTLDDVREMLTAGVMELVEPVPEVPDEMGRMETEIELLDAAKVRNGTKAIWLFLHGAWTEELRQRYGPFDDPATIRRWRTERRKAARAAEAMVRSDAD